MLQCRVLREISQGVPVLKRSLLFLRGFLGLAKDEISPAERLERS